MSGSEILLATIYFVYVVSPLISDELWLRIALGCTSLGFVVWGLTIDSPITVIANVLFAAMSLVQIIKQIRERMPIELEPGQQLVHESLFPSMTAREFLLFWHLGREVITDDTIIQAGEMVPDISVLVDGEFRVDTTNGPVHLQAPVLVGEMSYVRGEDVPASASVSTVGTATLRQWEKSTLRAMRETHPKLTVPFLRDLGAGLAEKVSN